MMSLSNEERVTLATMEEVLRVEDPSLVHTLATFTRRRYVRWQWSVFVLLLIFAPMTLIGGIALRNTVLTTLAAVQVGVVLLLATTTVLSLRDP